MSRPKPTILAEVTDKNTYKTEQVLASDGIWAVYYDDKPINLRSLNILIQYLLYLRTPSFLLFFGNIFISFL